MNTEYLFRRYSRMAEHIDPVMSLIHVGPVIEMVPVCVVGYCIMIILVYLCNHQTWALFI